MKRITTIFLIVLSGHLSMIAQTDTTAYSVVKNMPVFYEPGSVGKLPYP